MAQGRLKMKNLSLKEFERQEKIRQQVLKNNLKTVEKSNKEIKLIVDSAHIELDKEQVKMFPIMIEWLESMIEWEQDSLKVRTIRSYAQFHQGRISGMNLAIDLLNTIKNNNLKNK